MSILHVSDQQQRTAALDPTGSFIVKAPAGSGKTELLTQRLLVLLAGVDAPEEVVAITFTRKAAAEMRHRTFAAITQAAAPPQADLSSHKLHTRQLAEKVLERSRSRNWGLDENPQRLRIMTIDSFCGHLVSLSPVTSGFGGRMSPTDRPEGMYREAVRQTLKLVESQGDHADVIAKTLMHFDNRIDVVESQLCTLLARRDSWIGIATSERDTAGIRSLLEQTLAATVEEALVALSVAVPEHCRSKLLDSSWYAAENLLAAGSPAEAPRSWPSADVASLPQWLWLANLLITKSGGWRARLTAAEGFPPGTGAASKATAKQRKDDHLHLIEDLKSMPGALEALASVRELPSATYSQEQWEVLHALLDVMKLCAANLQVVFSHSGQVDFTEIAQQAVNSLGQDDVPTDLALLMDYRIRHLLVDEFQDTSALQFELFRRLTREWSHGDGRSLFVVGDPMQSIYRFRQAEVGLFIQAERNGIGACQLTPLELTSNFRSKAGIVDWVNHAFASILPERDDPNLSAVSHTTAIAVHESEPDPAVTVHPAVHPDIDVAEQEEARRVAEVCAATRAAFPEDSVAILVRGRSHLARIIPMLQASNVAYRAVDIEALEDRQVIADLRSLTRALLHPADRLSWLAVLRAPWFGLELADLHALTHDLPHHVSVLEAARDEQRLQNLTDRGRAALTRGLVAISTAMETQGSIGVRQWIQECWEQLGGAACLAETRDLMDARAFFDAIERMPSVAGGLDLTELDSAIGAIRATPDLSTSSPVMIMTIHKSKGLEFDHVLVPGLSRGTANDRPPPVIHARLSSTRGPSDLLLAPVNARGSEIEPTYNFIRKFEKARQRNEDDRLLYVATTRAARRLHLFGSTRLVDGAAARPAESTLLARLWSVVAGDFEAAAAAAAVAADVAAVYPDSSRAAGRSAHPILRLPSGFAAQKSASPITSRAAMSPPLSLSPPFDWAGEAARAVGIVFHRCALDLHRAPSASIGPERAAMLLAAEGIPGSLLQRAVDRVVHAIKQMQADDRGRWILDAGHSDSRAEWPITMVDGGEVLQLIIDRTFVSDGTRWVIDYKTSTHEGGDLDSFLASERTRYETQLARYRRALELYELQAGSRRPVRTALYFPLLSDPSRRFLEI